jgi:chromosome partitioning protein
MKDKKNHIIVIGNEKGGAGKTTTSMHLLVSLLHLGFKVNSIDVDCRQKSLSRYIENRSNYAKKHDLSLHLPNHFNVEPEVEDMQALMDQPEIHDCDFLLIDTPGSHTPISNYAHSLADTIITPINDSFIDLDVIAQIEADSLKIIRPSFYSQAIWEQKMSKARREQGEINWIILRNRLSHIDAKNKLRMQDVLGRLSERLGFRVASGFNERVIYRELFLQGLTLLDIKPGLTDITLSLSHVAAKQELNNFLKCLNIDKLNKALDNLKQTNSNS